MPLWLIEPGMYLVIGVLLGALAGLCFMPMVHRRAVRLTTRQLELAAPVSIAEIQTEKDQLRAQWAMSIRRLEVTIERMRTSAATHLAALGTRAEAIHQLRRHLHEERVTNLELEERYKKQRDQQRAAEDRAESQSNSLSAAERALAENEIQIAQLMTALSDKERLLGERDAEINRMRGWLHAAGNSESVSHREVVTERRASADKSRLPIETPQERLSETQIDFKLESEIAALEIVLQGSRMAAE
jgi:hypothetical protein